eukprot:g16635.t1
MHAGLGRPVRDRLVPAVRLDKRQALLRTRAQHSAKFRRTDTRPAIKWTKKMAEHPRLACQIAALWIW